MLDGLKDINNNNLSQLVNKLAEIDAASSAWL